MGCEQSECLDTCKFVLSGLLHAGLPTSARLSYVVLDGFQLPDPSGPAALIPANLLTPGSNSSLLLRDVRIVVDGPTLQQHVRFFSKLARVVVYTVSEGCGKMACCLCWAYAV